MTFPNGLDSWLMNTRQPNSDKTGRNTTVNKSSHDKPDQNHQTHGMNSSRQQQYTRKNKNYNSSIYHLL
jgi:hypothetical protein